MVVPDTRPADVERMVVDYLTANLTDEPTLTIGVGLPSSWRPSEPPHLQIDSFTTSSIWPVVTRPVIRCIAWCASTTDAKRIASKAFALLMTPDESVEFAQALHLTGPDPIRDDSTHAEICSIEIQVTLRTAPY